MGEPGWTAHHASSASCSALGPNCLHKSRVLDLYSARRPGRLRGFRFHLKAPNGDIIAASRGYETNASAEKGIEAIKTHAPSATVVDETG
ncbi:YegP family protein [Mycobacterium sp.]|uniref:YegP family protein n=1 Tax=Mycobacterium sp. TaxID=1785 RepID=UPI003BB54077